MPVCVSMRKKNDKKQSRAAASPSDGVQRKGEPPLVSQLENKYAPPGPGVAHSFMTVPPPQNLEDTAETSQQPAGNTLTEGGAVTIHTPKY